MMQAYLANNAQKWKQDDIENKNHEDALKELLKCSNPRQTCAKNIMISIFFDGTGNHKERDFSKGAHTNIARLYALHNSKETEGFFSIYLQGVGTPFKEIDDDGPFDLLRGAALGRGGMRRINYAYVEIINRISRFVAGVNVVEFMKVMNEGKNNIRRHSSSTINTAYGVRSKEEFDKLKKDSKKILDQNITIDLENNFLDARNASIIVERLKKTIGDKKAKLGTINLAVFGFSRGAAEARAFLNHFQSVFPNNKIGDFFINIYFAGLFDTVSSVGLVDIFDSNTKSLDGFYSWAKKAEVTPKHVKKLYHFVALNEVRACFPLTSLSGFPTQYAYPGAHSDVGGGYGDCKRFNTGANMYNGTQGKYDISIIPGRHMYFLARRAGVPLLSLSKAKNYQSFLVRDAASAYLDTKYDSAFDKFLLEISKNGFPQGKPHSLIALSNLAHIEYLKHRGIILNDFETRDFYKHCSSREQQQHLLAVNNHIKTLLFNKKNSYNYVKGAYNYARAKSPGVLKANEFPSEDAFLSNINPLLNLVNEYSKKKQQNLKPSEIVFHKFYSDYVHDSVASFIGMGVNETVVNGMGILKFRKIYDY